MTTSDKGTSLPVIGGTPPIASTRAGTCSRHAPGSFVTCMI